MHLDKIWVTLLISAFSAWVGYYLRDIGTYKDFIRSRQFDIIDEINALKDLSTKYWSRDVKASDRRDDDIAQESEMVAKNHAINLALVSLSKNFDNRSYSELTSMTSEIRRCSTSRPFEDDKVDRSPDAQRIKEIHRRCFEMIEKIRVCARKPRGIWWRF